MTSRLSDRRFSFCLRVIFFGLVLLAGRELRAQGAPATPAAGSSVVTLGGAPADARPFIKAAGAGVEAAPRIPSDAGIAVYEVTNRPISEADHDAMVALLKRGGSVILTLTSTSKSVYTLEDLSPVNFWSVEATTLQRLSAGALAPAGSPLAPTLQTPGFRLPARYDLHLPYSDTETGQHRYEWERMGKALLNTDWQVLLTNDQDGRLPLLVEGRCYAGRVFVFGGNLYAPELVQWPGYAGFVHALLDLARPEPVPAGPAVDSLKLSVAPYQPGSGDLQVGVTNPGRSEIRAVLAGKVQNLTRGLMHSFSREIDVPAGKTITVSFPEGAPARGTADAPPSGETALPFRRLELGLAPLTRQEVAVRLAAVVDRTPALTLAIEGEDVRNFPEQEGWPAGGSDYLPASQGVRIDRYTYFCGQTPKVTVHLNNGRHNIAPLAAALDVAWPDNPSTQGLNDGAFSYDSVRGKFPVTGFWSGRAAETQQIRLTWPLPVLVAGQQLFAQTPHRHWDLSNPLNYTLTGQSGGQLKTLATVRDAAYVFGSRADTFSPAAAASCTLNITGLDPKGHPEPSAVKPFIETANTPVNCSLGEWAVDGWPGATPPPAVGGHLRVVLHDLTTDKTSTLVDRDLTLDPISQFDFAVDAPTRKTFGQVCIHAEFRPASGETVSADFPLLFVPENQPHLLSLANPDAASMGLLCSPGFWIIDDFGLGTNEDTQGWGGPDDKTWAWTHDLMETGSDARTRYIPQRFLLSPVGLSHYTDPWRDFPSGEYVWDWATDHFAALLTTGKFKGKKTFHTMLADRWNGIAIGAAFTWADFISFDEYLRAEGKPGLTGRTRAELCQEIVSRHSDEFQRYELGRYADAMSHTEEKLAALGVEYTSETHGSFPLAGGKLGEQLATTDVGVGTDLFWELREEDVFKGIGFRLGVVAANPDLKSGAYDQWEWTSATQQNATWFSPSGDVEPARLQWYNTYWKGRITSDGQFQPYTVYGFTMEGDYGTKSTLDDWIRFNRVQSTMIWVRPEEPVGVGIVASWQLQENNMAPNSTTLGFGLYASNGYHPDNPRDHTGAHDQVDAAVGEAYFRLVENGVPVSFVASTETLKKWHGTQPLVAVDGFETDPWELAIFDRLNQAGAPIIALGSDSKPDRAAAETLFGVKRSGQGWVADQATEVFPDDAGQPLAYVCRRPGRAPTLFCPLPIVSLNGPQSAILAGAIQHLCGEPFTLPYGVAAAPFISNHQLFVAFSNTGDSSRGLDIGIRPSALNPAYQGEHFRVIDHDRGEVVPSEWKDGALHFRIPAAPNDGRLLQFVVLP